MGLIMRDFGKMGVEMRRDSFIIHPSYGYKGEGDDVEHDDSEPWKTAWRENPHPEFLLEDLDDLIAALQYAKTYVTERAERGSKKTMTTHEEFKTSREAEAMLQSLRHAAQFCTGPESSARHAERIHAVEAELTRLRQQGR